jgi:hypothetical protein
MTSSMRIRATVIVSAACAHVASAQGLYWETSTTGIGKEARTAQTYAMPKMMKIVNADGHMMILRADRSTFISVDPKRQMYQELTFAEIESASKSMQAPMEAARGEMEKQMKGMSPEQRAMMEKMMPKMPSADTAKSSPVVVQNTGETKTLAGHTCTKYVATQDGQTVLVAWTAKDVKGFDALRGDWLEYQKRLTGTNRAFGSALADAYAKIDGFPMETEMDNLKVSVTKVEARTTPATEFEVPAGYKKESVNLPKPPQKP